MTTELDRIAKKNTQQKIKGAYKNLGIKRHNLKAALKANKADPEEQGWFGSKRSKSIRKKLNKVNKTDKWVEKQADRLREHGVWGKENRKGSGLASLEKRDIIKKGFPSKAKMDIDVHRPNFPAKKLKAGGIALRGLGRAFMKGGKV